MKNRSNRPASNRTTPMSQATAAIVSRRRLGSGAKAHAPIETLEGRTLLSGSLTITPTFDSSIKSLPNSAAIESSINTVIANFEAKVTSNVPVTVSIDFMSTDSGLANSQTAQADLDYSTYLADLKANPNKSSNDVTALATMPAGPNTGINNATQVLLTAANLAALGDSTDAQNLVTGNGGFNSILQFNFSIINDSRPDADPNKYDLQSVATHEIDEVLGIGGNATTLYQPGSTPPSSLPTDVSGLDFFRYSARARSFTYDPTTSAYFSIDGGKTKLVNFNQQNGDGGSDFGDWGNPQGTGEGNTPPNVQDAFGTPGGMANLGVNELTGLDVIGWNLISQGSAPVVTTNPKTQTVAPGATVTLTAAATGTPTPTVQWQYSVNGGATFTNISGATSTTFTFTAAAAKSGHEYRAVFTNSAGSATTAAATVTVTSTNKVAPVVTLNPTSKTVTARNHRDPDRRCFGNADPNRAMAIQHQRRRDVHEHRRRDLNHVQFHGRRGQERAQISGRLHQLGRLGHDHRGDHHHHGRQDGEPHRCRRIGRMWRAASTRRAPPAIRQSKNLIR